MEYTYHKEKKPVNIRITEVIKMGNKREG